MTHLNRFSSAALATALLAAASFSFAGNASTAPSGGAVPLMGQVTVTAKKPSPVIRSVVDLGGMTVLASRDVLVADLGGMTISAQRDVVLSDLGSMTVTADREIVLARNDAPRARKATL